jgi:hypothetical protein
LGWISVCGEERLLTPMSRCFDDACAIGIISACELKTAERLDDQREME